MDVGKLNIAGKANVGFRLILSHPVTGDPTNVFVHLLGKDSTGYRKLSFEQSRARLQRMQKTGKWTTPVPEDFEKDTVALLATCTTAWGEVDAEGNVAKETLTYQGEELPCTRDNVMLVYTNELWIREQVDGGVGDRANFQQG